MLPTDSHAQFLACFDEFYVPHFHQGSLWIEHLGHTSAVGIFYLTLWMLLYNFVTVSHLKSIVLTVSEILTGAESFNMGLYL